MVFTFSSWTESKGTTSNVKTRHTNISNPEKVQQKDSINHADFKSLQCSP